jgi:hypothetical protein
MSFAEVMKKTYSEAIEPAVRDDCGFDCRRIDAKEYNGGVVDEIKAEIRESRSSWPMSLAIGTASITRPDSPTDGESP